MLLSAVRCHRWAISSPLHPTHITELIFSCKVKLVLLNLLLCVCVLEDTTGVWVDLTEYGSMRLMGIQLLSIIGWGQVAQLPMIGGLFVHNRWLNCPCWLTLNCLSDINRQSNIYSLNIIMGNDPGNSSLKRTKAADYQFVAQLASNRRLMRSKSTSQQVVLIQHTFACEQLLNQYIKQAKKLYSITHQFYLNSFEQQVLSVSNLCSKQYKVVEYFEYEPHSLEEQIRRRAKAGRYFSQKQIMSILCSCVLAMSHLSKLDVTHYTLNPSDILLDHHGICKIACSALSHHLFDFNYNQHTYYAPQTLKIFKLQSVANGLATKCAVFTLGMTLLHMIFLTPVSHLYNATTFTVDVQQLNQLISRVESSDLKQILRKMLKYHSYDRITFTELQEMLFDVIVRNQHSGHTSQTCFQNHQSQKLQQSIVRIQNEEPINEQQSNQPLDYHNYRPQDQLQYTTAQYLQRDVQDEVNINQLVSHCQQVILDQSDKVELYSARQSSLTLFSQNNNTNKLSHCTSIHQRVLTDHSNHPYNNALSQRQINQHYPPNKLHYPKEDYTLHKENQRQNYTHLPHNHQLIDQQTHPRYVSEQVAQGRYEGYKLGKYRHGFGTFYYKEGGKYCGQWVRNRMQGKGVLYYASGKIAYQGQWKQDMLNGYGVLYNQNIQVMDCTADYAHLQSIGDEWIKYQGYFNEDMKHGQGTLFLSNGQSFRGMFQNDQPNGPGQFRNICGQVSRGFWLMGALNSTS